MLQETIPTNNEKNYAVAFEEKRRAEEKRDRINNFNTTIGALAVSAGSLVLPQQIHLSYSSVALIPMAGIMLSIAWLVSLFQIGKSINAIETILVTLEEKGCGNFIISMKRQLGVAKTERPITFSISLIPLTFIIVNLFLLKHLMH